MFKHSHKLTCLYKKKSKAVPIHVINVYGAAKVQLHSLTLALVGGEWLASCPICFTSRQKTPGIHIQEEQRPQLHSSRSLKSHSTPPWHPHIINSTQTTEHKIQCLILENNDMHMHTVLLQR
jgi:hypothetical protein